MNRKWYIVCAGSFLVFARAFADPYTINMFVRDYPEEQVKTHPRSIGPLEMNKQRMKTYFYQPVSRGVYALYNGQLASTNEYGLLSFIRDTQLPEFTLVITESIAPEFLSANTISHWTITNPQQTDFYLIRQNKDPETKVVYWKTQKTNVPQDHIVPLLHSIVVLAKPEDVYVPLGVTPTTKLPNLLLPPIYAKRSLDRIKQALFILNIKQFFAPVGTLMKAEKLNIMSLVTP